MDTAVLCIVSFILAFLLLEKAKKKINSKGLLRIKKNRDTTLSEYENFVAQLSFALFKLSESKLGALIVVERNSKLNNFIPLGYEIKAKVNPEFLINIFGNKSSALHDGGVIIRKFNIVSISTYLPVTQSKFTDAIGARHRAAIGLSEQTDAISFIVSETTGKISYCSKGKIYELVNDDLSVLSDQLFETLNFYID